MNVFLHNVGLDFLQESDFRILENLAQNSGIIFNGYHGYYKYLCLGNSEISFRMKPVKWDGNTAVEFVCDGYDVGFRSDTFWRGLVSAVHDIQGDEGGVCIDVMADTSEKGWYVPVTLMHADVLPSIAYNDEIVMQVVCFPKKITYFESAQDEKEPLSFIIRPIAGTIIPYSRIARKFIDNEESRDPRMVIFSARISHVRYHQPESARFAPKVPIVCVTVQTTNGPLDIAHVLNDLSERQQSLIKPGNDVQVLGWFSVDVALGEYQGGAIFDQHHNLRLPADCIRKRVHSGLWVFFPINAGISPRMGSGVKAQRPLLPRLMLLARALWRLMTILVLPMKK